MIRRQTFKQTRVECNSGLAGLTISERIRPVRDYTASYPATWTHKMCSSDHWPLSTELRVGTMKVTVHAILPEQKENHTVLLQPLLLSWPISTVATGMLQTHQLTSRSSPSGSASHSSSLITS